MRRLLALSVVAFCTLAAPAAAAISERQAVESAASQARVRATLDQTSGARARAELQSGKWIVTFDSGGRVRAQATVDASNGQVLEAYTGQKAEFPLARGRGSGVAQRKLNAWWLWLPLTLLFALAFFDPRKPWRLLHLDIAVVALFGSSYAFFMRGELRTSVPLAYPLLVYMLVRMLLAGARPRTRPGPLSVLPLRWLIRLTVALVVGRAVLMLADPFTLDVGYASAAGAERILDGLELYTRGGNHLDTYGPIAYLAYVPFVLLWPLRQAQENPPAAQAAALVFDLATVAGLVVLGRRLRGPVLGWTLAFAWAACPFTALSLVSVSNDALVAALLVWALIALRSATGVGSLLGAAAAAKFSPALLLPLFVRRRGPLVLAGAAIVGAASLLPLLPDGGLREFYDATVGFQLHRASPFSIWTQHPSLEALQTALKVFSLVLALAVAFVPGRRDVGRLAALGAAVLIAEQIPLQHWFYLYLVWVLPLYCVALFSEHGEPATQRAADVRPAAWRRLLRPGAAPASCTARSSRSPDPPLPRRESP